MTTLSVLIIVCTFIGWCVRWIESNQGKYEFNPFAERVSFSSITLLLSTVLSILILLSLIVTYLP